MRINNSEAHCTKASASLCPWYPHIYLSNHQHSASSAFQTEQLRLFPEPVWAVAAEPEVSQTMTPCQRLVEETERVGEEGGGKFRSSSTATPTLLRRVNMQEAATHLLLRGLYFSMELRLELPSLPPTAYNQPSIATRSWVLLEGEGRNKPLICSPIFLYAIFNCGMNKRSICILFNVASSRLRKRYQRKSAPAQLKLCRTN